MRGFSYGTSNGGTYGDVEGAQYGAVPLGERLELYEPGEIGPTITTDDIVSISIGLEHTAVSDMEIELPPFAEITTERFRNGEMKLYTDGVLLFRAEFHELDVAKDYTITIGGVATEEVPLLENEIDRTYSDARMKSAIRDVVEDLPFDINIIDGPSRTIDNEIVQTAAVGAGFEGLLTEGEDIDYYDKETWRDFPSPYDEGNDIIHTLHDTTPLKIVEEGLTITQTCDFVEAEDFSGQQGTTTVSDNDASGFTAVDIVDVEDYIEVDFGFEHTIPAEHFNVSIRGRVPATGSDPYDKIELDIDSNTINTVFSGGRFGGPNFFWADRIIDGVSKDISAGDGPNDKNHTLRIEKTLGDDTVRIDCIAFYDDRFDFEFDPAGITSTDSNGALTEPGLYPARVPAIFDLAPVGAILSGARIEAVMDFTGETNLGTIGFVTPSNGSHETGGTPVDVTGSEWTLVLDEPIDESSNTSRVHAHVDPAATTFTGSEEPTTTPKNRTGRQTCTHMEFDVTGEEEAVISGERSFQGTPMDVLQTMHEDAGMRFNVEHGVRDGHWPPVFTSYETRDNSQLRSTDDWVITDVDESSDIGEYANKVTVIGAPLVTGSGARARATVEDEIEIENLRDLPDDDGIRPVTIRDESLETVNDCLSKARTLLREYVNADNVGGSVTATPILPTPGPQYLTEFFGRDEVGGWGNDWGLSWGTTRVGNYSALESATYTESAGSAATEMEFEEYEGLYRVVTEIPGE